MTNGLTIPEDGKPPSTIEEKQITPPSSAQRAAFNRVGISGKKFKALTAKARIGNYLDQLGLFELGAANMLLDVENIDSSMAACDKIIEASGDAEVQLRALELKTQLQEQRIKLTKMHLEAKPPSQPTGGTVSFPIMPATGSDIFIAVKDAKALESKKPVE